MNLTSSKSYLQELSKRSLNWRILKNVILISRFVHIKNGKLISSPIHIIVVQLRLLYWIMECKYEAIIYPMYGSVYDLLNEMLQITLKKILE